MVQNIDLEVHEKRHTAFHQKRLERAKAQVFDTPVTAFLSDVFITSCTAVGVTFEHKNQNAFTGRFVDGHRIRTSDIQRAEKQGRFWVLTTMNSTYVVSSFKREIGRASLHKFLAIAKGSYHHTPASRH
ncbi:hypothetical protein [Pseudomonas serbica]|uniref:hypothetical protein n=1 Tax=Pseudomonas serbica TaxID=2965074 RepID=UPI00237BDB8C|nr:hypothetical protein [Pseudomonas serbica]